MCVIDEMEQTLGCVTLHHSSKDLVFTPSKYSTSGNLMKVVYPNPGKDKIIIHINPAFSAGKVEFK